MTIAAGLLYDGGVLLAADTLMTSDTMGVYNSKFIAHRFDDGVAVFGLAGNVNFAESAAQACEAALVEYSGKPRVVSQIADTIRDVLAHHYKVHVIDNGLQYTHFYNFVIGIQSSVDGVGLYVTDMTAMKQTRRGFECVGNGHDLAQFLIGGLYQRYRSKELNKLLTAEWVSVLVYNAIAHIRHFIPGSVGGDPIFVMLRNDGFAPIMGGTGFSISDQRLRQFHSATQRLLMEFFSTKTDAEFVRELSGFAGAIKRDRDLWKSEVEALVASTKAAGTPMTWYELDLSLDLGNSKTSTRSQAWSESPAAIAGVTRREE